jgi:thiamine-phosphate pyrophosphorylase
VTALMGLAARLRLARLYLSTDTRSDQNDLAQFLAAAFAGGVDIVQIRQKGMARKAELEALETARTVATTHQGIVCVNDSADLAAEFHADMLHLGQTDGPSGPARRQLHPWALLGRSTHSPEQVDEALADPDVSYFTVGPVYATSSKPDFPPVGLELVRYAAKVAPVTDVSSKPWFAVGGIAADNLDELITAGARRVWVVRPITQAADPRAAAGELRRGLQAAWKAEPGMDRYIQHALANG